MRMRGRYSAGLLALILLSWPLVGRAQTPKPAVDAELQRIETAFDYGKYAEVLESVPRRIDAGNLSEEARRTLYQLAALAAFNLDRHDEARRNFQHLLRLDPDHELDPFRVPPPAIELLETTRDDMAEELEAIRQQLELRRAQELANADARESERKELDQLRAELAELNARVTERVVQRHHILVNFMPFGLGQFQQGRHGVGVGLAVAQGALAATSVVAYATRWTLRENVTETVQGRIGQDPFERTIWMLPASRRESDEIWAVVQVATGAAFYLAWAYGVIDALIHHRDIVPLSKAPAPEGPRFHLQPAPGGGHAGFTLHF